MLLDPEKVLRVVENEVFLSLIILFFDFCYPVHLRAKLQSSWPTCVLKNNLYCILTHSSKNTTQGKQCGLGILQLLPLKYDRLHPCVLAFLGRVLLNCQPRSTFELILLSITLLFRLYYDFIMKFFEGH